MTGPAVFIGGAGRSGTTLLADLLGMHPDLSPVYETDFVADLARLLFVDGVPSAEDGARRVEQYMAAWAAPLPHRPHNKRGHERYVHGPHHILFDAGTACAAAARFAEALRGGAGPDAFGGFVAGLLDDHARRDGKPRWVNKTPAYIGMLPILDALFPDMVFLHCVRDGRAVAASVVTRPWGPASFAEAGPWWAASLEKAAAFGDPRPGKVIDVRYEDLLDAPEAALAPVLAGIGAGGDAADVCTAYRAAGGSLDPGRAYAWRETVSQEDRAAFEAGVGPWLARHRYPV